VKCAQHETRGPPRCSLYWRARFGPLQKRSSHIITTRTSSPLLSLHTTSQLQVTHRLQRTTTTTTTTDFRCLLCCHLLWAPRLSTSSHCRLSARSGPLVSSTGIALPLLLVIPCLRPHFGAQLGSYATLSSFSLLMVRCVTHAATFLFPSKPPTSRKRRLRLPRCEAPSDAAKLQTNRERDSSSLRDCLDGCVRHALSPGVTTPRHEVQLGAKHDAFRYLCSKARLVVIAYLSFFWLLDAAKKAK